MGFLKGKKALIVGLASSRSIAYGVAQAFHQQGAELAFAYQSEKLSERVKDLAKDFNYRPKTKVEDGIQNFVNWYRSYYGV